ncbi:DUF4920 domain-containing protein [uncultured Zobellia sp.]|uniref:DUF4920 domain-containing protein n=1 Tax=uncultured Zobellia sp. TaxID=255433 RepID=UPI00259770EB|nr:DUF4920 domain-containing protein [uncultured Zobellia sp.]
MRVFNNLLAVFMVVLACSGQETKEITYNGVNYKMIGANLEASNALTSAKMARKYSGMSVQDTLRTKFKATVTDVCKVKGCWMKLQLNDGRETMVRFKDYAFFMPSDITGKEIIVNGYAYVESMSVEDQKHYAKDGGKSESEIAKIKEHKKTLGFEADGVLIENK